MTLCACASAFPQRIRAIIAVSYPLQVTWYESCVMTFAGHPTLFTHFVLDNFRLLSLFNTNRLYDGAFGALVASSSSANIAPTTEHHPPTLFIIGTRDQFTSAAKLERFVRERVKDPKQIEVVDGADHFWFGREEQVCALVVNFLQRWGVLTATAH